MRQPLKETCQRILEVNIATIPLHLQARHGINQVRCRRVLLQRHTFRLICLHWGIYIYIYMYIPCYVTRCR